MKNIFNRLLQSLVLVLVCLTILPCNVVNASDEPIAYIIDGNDIRTNFYDVDSAIEASYSIYGITMLKDWDIYSEITIAEGYTSTIRMDGHVIKYAGKTNNYNRIFTLEKNSSLHLTGSETEKEYSDGLAGRVLSGGLITNGYRIKGGAIFMNEGSNLEIRNVAIAGNTSLSYGGAIYVDGDNATMTLDNVKIYNNYAKNDGGAFYVDGKNCNITLKDTLIYSNRTDKSGGAFYIDKQYCTIKMDNSTISNNYSSSRGNAIYVNDTNFTLEMENYSTIKESKESGYDGAAIFLNYSWFNIFSNDKTASIKDNEGYSGPAIYADSQYIRSEHGTIKGINFTNNKSNNSGGALFIGQNNVTIEDCVFNGNISTNGNGGAICFSAKGTIKNSTITDNKAVNGGGVFIDQAHDLTLSGLVNIYNNTNRSNEKDDVYLYEAPSLSAYIIANNIDEKSLIGIRTGNSSDRKLVNNLSEYNYNSTFFLDDGDNFHLGYQENANQLWQRKGATTYKLTVDGTKIGDYKAGSKVTITNNIENNNRVFKQWKDSAGVSFADKTSKTTTITMPSYDIELNAEYVDVTKDITLTIDYPVVGQKLDSTAILSFDGCKENYEVEINWYKAGQENTSIDANYIVKEGEQYIPQIKLSTDLNKNLYLSSNITKNDIKLKYGDTYFNASFVKYFANQSISIIGEAVGEDDKSVSSINPLTIKVPAYITNNALIALINKQISEVGVKVYTNYGKEYTLKFNALSDNDKTIINGWYENGYIKVPDGYYTLDLTPNNTDNLNLGSNKATLRVDVITDDTITKVDDLNVSINQGSYISILKNAIPSQIQVSAKNGKKYIVNVDKDQLDLKLQPLTIADRVKLLDDGSDLLTFTLPLTTTKDDTTIRLNGKTLTVNITVNKVSTGSAFVAIPHIPCGGLYQINNAVMTVSQDEITTYSEDEYKFDEDGNFYVKATCDDQEATIYYQINDYTDSEELTDEEGWINLGKDAVCTLTVYAVKNTTDGTLVSSKVSSVYIIDGEFFDFTYLQEPTFETKEDTYIPDDEDITTLENGDISLNVYFANSSYNIKYFINDGTTIQEYDNSKGITLTCPEGEFKAYMISAWTYDEDGHQSFVTTANYALDNRGFDESKLLINTLITIKKPTANEKLASNAKVSGSYLGETFKKDDVNVTWSTNDEIAIYDNQYLATLDIDSMFAGADDKQDIVNMINASVNDTYGNSLSNANAWAELENNKIVLKVLFPKTESYSDPALKFTLKSINTADYVSEISYEDALNINNDFSNFALPYVILNASGSNNTSYFFKEDASSLFKLVKSFNPNNYDAQEIVFRADINSLIPEYINKNNVDTTITFKIKVRAKLGYVPNEVIDKSSDKAVTCEEYMKSKDWTWSESKKACVYRVSNTSSN